MQYVIRALRDIRPGTVITIDLVEVQSMYAADSDACSSLEEVLHKVAKELVPQGEIIRLPALEQSVAPTEQTTAKEWWQK